MRSGLDWDGLRAALTLVGTFVPLEVSGSVAFWSLRRGILALMCVQVPSETGFDGEGLFSFGESFLAQRLEIVIMMGVRCTSRGIKGMGERCVGRGEGLDQIKTWSE